MKVHYMTATRYKAFAFHTHTKCVHENAYTFHAPSLHVCTSFAPHLHTIRSHALTLGHAHKFSGGSAVHSMGLLQNVAPRRYAVGRQQLQCVEKISNLKDVGLIRQQFTLPLPNGWEGLSSARVYTVVLSFTANHCIRAWQSEVLTRTKRGKLPC